MSDNIFLFVPNIIGYIRIVLAIISFWYMLNNPVITTCCYLLSGLLDAFDGHAARLLNQGTKFGAMLDMLTDRCATMCLLVALGHLYPSWMILFQISMSVDIASHWLHMHVSIMEGSSSHKSVDLSKNIILYHYYTNRTFLFFMCAGNELFYSMLYICNFTIGPAGLWLILAILTFPVALIKTGISIIHLYAASLNLAAIDMKERMEKSS